MAPMKLSLVELSPVLPDQNRHDALMNAIKVAQHIENLGFQKIWFAEHHGAESIAGRAPEVLIAAAAAATDRISLGSGSVLLNHYSPFKVAEVFCTLNELYPGRINLGAGRATTGPVTDFALQQARDRKFQANSDEQIVELVTWLNNDFPVDHPFAKSPIHTDHPIPDLYLLGSSSWSASAAAALGLRYVFAGFINQAGTPSIIASYRSKFKPTDKPTGVKSPQVILSVHVVCADTDEEARRQIAPVSLMYKKLAKGDISGRLPFPDDAVKQLGYLPDLEEYKPGSGQPPKFIAGSPARVKDIIDRLAADLQVDEIMIQDMFTDLDARFRSYDLLAEVFGLGSGEVS